jgi:hypothetical protein
MKVVVFGSFSSNVAHTLLGLVGVLGHQPELGNQRTLKRCAALHPNFLYFGQTQHTQHIT